MKQKQGASVPPDTCMSDANALVCNETSSSQEEELLA